MPPVRPRLRVATYNVHACVGTDGRHDPDRVASVITELDADIVALQEFSRMLLLVKDSRDRSVVAALHDHLWRHVATHFHAPTRWIAMSAPSVPRGRP